MNRDPFYAMIMRRLAEPLDGELFEQCAADLLRDIYPALVPVRGGADGGMDGAIADGEGEAYALITTTGKNVLGNLRRNLQSYLQRGHSRRKAVLATSQSLTSRKRDNLETAARELGFILVQVHDRNSFAELLYRDSAWCRELLGLSGDPCPLSIVPASTRPVLTQSLLGRDEDMLWLKSTEGDRLLVGQPGSGKTFLLRQLAREGFGLFVISRDRGENASGIRDQEPTLVFVDDAMPSDQVILDLVQLRDSTGAEFEIVATCWTNFERDIAEMMRLPSDKVRELDRLTRDEIAQVVREADPTLPKWLIQEIVLQAEGLPGLAVSLTYLCSMGDVREVALGEELLGTWSRQLKRLVKHHALTLLAIVSLSGERGMTLSHIAEATGKDQTEIHGILADIGAAGVIQQARDRYIRVRPDRLRYALVRDTFFGPYSLAIDEYIGYSTDAEQLALTLIGARSAGADVPNEMLWRIVVDAGSPQAIESYAWLGETEVRRAIRLTATMPAFLARPALRYVPEETIPLLFQQAIGDDRPLHPYPQAPLRIIDDWVKEARPGVGVAIPRRSMLLGQIGEWARGSGDHRVSTRALRSVFTPGFFFNETEPGSGLRATLTWGWLEREEVAQLRALWPKAVELLSSFKVVDWNALMALAEEWIYPSLHTVDPGPDLTNLVTAGGRQMVLDISSLAIQHPVILRWALQKASDLSITLDVTIDPDFATLYPVEGRREWRLQERELTTAARTLGQSWAAAHPVALARHLRWIEDEAQLIDRPWPRLSPIASAALASAVEAAIPWIDAFMDEALLADLVLPLLTLAGARGEDGWQEQIKSALEQERYAWIAIQTTLALPAPTLDLLDHISTRLQGHEHMIEIMAMGGEMSEQVLAYLLDGDRSVAAAAAWGEWAADPEGTVRESLRDRWREAIVHYEDDYWLSRILAADASLALDWLSVHLSDERFRFWEYDQTLVAIADALGKDSKLSILATLPRRYNVEVVAYYLLRADPQTYQAFLQNDRLSNYHLLPLSGHPQGTWIDLALRALNAGYSAADIAAAAYSAPCMLMSHWSGDESGMWAQWIEMFERLGRHSDQRLHEVADLGVRIASQRRDRALREERDEAVYGLR